MTETDAPPPPPKRATKVRDRRTSAIFEAAVREFATSGYEGTSVQRIADGAGLTKWQVLYFFKSKENLYRETVDHIFDEWRSQELGRWEGAPRAIVGEYVDHIMRLAQTRPELSKIIVSEMLRGGGIAVPLLSERDAAAAMARTTGRLQRWMESGEMAQGSAFHFMMMLWSMQHFYVVFAKEVAYFLGKDDLDDADWEEIRANVRRAALSFFPAKR